jgi:hypothetical protein
MKCVLILCLFQERTTDETKIREEILSLIAQHVKAVNHIYSNTLFDGKESYKNIRFEVQRIKVNSPPPPLPLPLPLLIESPPISPTSFTPNLLFLLLLPESNGCGIRFNSPPRERLHSVQLSSLQRLQFEETKD